MLKAIHLSRHLWMRSKWFSKFLNWTSRKKYFQFLKFGNLEYILSKSSSLFDKIYYSLREIINKKFSFNFEKKTL
ncbi:unnamed protein product [Blepharisma stoltei]|uniref:Ribosomal protein S3 n=1 Tax=Blepharisma stoltei TaxID=1481888 RepID=A0AAU9J1K6_9CILI|nr:unnamed protein product [Blepharisma stoltei]